MSASSTIAFVEIHLTVLASEVVLDGDMLRAWVADRVLGERERTLVVAENDQGRP